MQSQSQLPKVSTRLGLVWLEYRLGLVLFPKMKVSTRNHLHHWSDYSCCIAIHGTMAPIDCHACSSDQLSSATQITLLCTC